MLTHCQTCKFFSQPLHSGDLACAIAPYYVELWSQLQELPQTTIAAFPIEECRDYEPLPPYDENAACIRRTQDDWHLIAQVRSGWSETGTCYSSLTELLDTEQVLITGCYADQSGEFFTVRLHSFPADQADNRTARTISGNRQSAIAAFEQTRMISVVSSHIVQIGYAWASQILFVRFERTGVYAYFNVPEAVWQDFQDAPSKGRFRNAEIQGYYSYVQLSET